MDVLNREVRAQKNRDQQSVHGFFSNLCKDQSHLKLIHDDIGMWRALRREAALTRVGQNEPTKAAPFVVGTKAAPSLLSVISR